MKKNILCFLAVTIFCFIFGRVYTMFGHGVESKFMNGLPVWPGIAMVWYFIFGTMKIPFSRIGENLFNAGIATLTVGSALKGIFEIAGTSSAYENYFFYVGYVLVLFGIVFGFLKPHNKEI